MESHWQTHKTRLRHYISKQIENESSVDDILQDVYIKAHTQQHKLKSQDSIGAWLYRIAHNTIMDHFRQQKPWEELVDTLEAPIEDEALLKHQELAECLTPLMQELPEKYGVPLQL